MVVNLQKFKMTSKFLVSSLMVWLSGATLEQMDIIQLDNVNGFVYYGVLGTSFLLYVFKRLLELYEKKKEIDKKYKDD